MVDDGFLQDCLFQNSATGERPLLAVVGDTLLMDTVEAYLSKENALDIVRIQTDVANTGRYLTSLAPDLVIFDRDAPQATYVLSYCRDRTRISMVVLDVHSNKAIVLSNRLNTIRTAGQLCQIIQELFGHQGGESKDHINKECFSSAILKHRM